MLYNDIFDDLDINCLKFLVDLTAYFILAGFVNIFLFNLFVSLVKITSLMFEYLLMFDYTYEESIQYCLIIMLL